MSDPEDFIVFRRDEFLRWWRQASVGGTLHHVPAPLAVLAEEWTALAQPVPGEARPGPGADEEDRPGG